MPMGGKKPKGRRPARKPHFFKVLMGDFQQRLRIPPKFMKHISKEASKRATLQGPNGSSWQVELGKTMEGGFLLAGWPDFVKDHFLKEHEFLVFRYNGNMHFSVQIFDTTACEREDVFATKIHKKPIFFGGQKRRVRPVKHPLDGDFICKCQSSKSHLSELLADETPTNQIQEGCISSPNPIGNTIIKTEAGEIPISMADPYSYKRKVYFSRRRPVTDEERLKAQEAAKAFTSVFPYIIRCMTTAQCYKRFTLNFPSSFSRAHLPRKRTNIVLRDPTGKAWVVAYLASQRDGLSAGWSAFARSNKLEEGDFCAFELVSADPVELCVHIFRVVEDTSPQKKD